MRGVTTDAFAVFSTAAISTHTPHAGRDLTASRISQQHCAFQLTRPMRGVTQRCGYWHYCNKFQLTRPMRGVTTDAFAVFSTAAISTHTPHAGRDGLVDRQARRLHQFQLTRPMRGVTSTQHLKTCTAVFQLTRPMRGVTSKLLIYIECL